ncbi:beta-1,3-galactosyltransferase 5-like [Babylonia areolata]|uniref:beta-1,3-galactosyltransferase 5-like n=1 Tax=Babylonia areolata TaxID=304850 RepID=UPI003FCFF53B
MLLLPTGGYDRRRMHLMRIRSYFLMLVFSVLVSFPLLYISIPVHQLNHHQGGSANSSLNVRPRSCKDCFRAEFPLLLNHPAICSVRDGGVVDMIFFIFTRPEGVETRHAIRNTWASVTRNNTANFRHVFVTGVTPDFRRIHLLGEESRHFRDVVVYGFNDSYNNLTLKTVTSLRWITRYCEHARFFFKVDDDVWVNTGALLTTFNQSLDLSSGLAGYCHMSSRVIRDPSSKWYTSYESYSEDSYPDYCSGMGYGGTLALARWLLRVSPNVPFFFLEDVYVGLCLRELNLSTVHFEELGARRSWDPCHAHTEEVLSYHKIAPWALASLWNVQKNCRTRSRFWRFLTLDFVFI